MTDHTPTEDEIRDAVYASDWGKFLIKCDVDPYKATPSTRDVARIAVDRIEQLERDLETTEKVIESLRPVWAQGYTDDGRAAQAYAIALSEIWKILNVDNQTMAMDKLRKLINDPD